MTAAQTDTKTALLNAAEAAIRIRGFSGFSFADLAAAVGIRKASIHHHFPTKQDLALRLVQRYRSQNTDRLADVEVSGGSGAAMIAAFVENLSAEYADSGGLDLGTALSAFPDHLSDAAREELGGLQQDNIDWLQWAIGEGARDGSLRAEKPKAAARALTATIIGAQIAARTSGSTKIFSKTISGFLRHNLVAK